MEICGILAQVFVCYGCMMLTHVVLTGDVLGFEMLSADPTITWLDQFNHIFRNRILVFYRKNVYSESKIFEFKLGNLCLKDF